MAAAQRTTRSHPASHHRVPLAPASLPLPLRLHQHREGCVLAPAAAGAELLPSAPTLPTPAPYLTALLWRLCECLRWDKALPLPLTRFTSRVQ